MIGQEKSARVSQIITNGHSGYSNNFSIIGTTQTATKLSISTT